MQIYTGNVLVMQDKEAVAAEVAQRFACAAVRAVAEHGVFCVAVPGGSSPRRIFELLSSPEYSTLMPWAKIHVFFTDERCVPPDDPESNYGQAREMLFRNVPIPETNVHRFMGEMPPDDAAEAYERDLITTLGEFPALDLVVLGMGSDTHTASLFPGSPALGEERRLAVSNYVEKLGAYRLTLTYTAINSAREVIVIAVGTDKSDAVREALSTEPDYLQHPVQGVRPTSGKLMWIVDRDAYGACGNFGC